MVRAACALLADSSRLKLMTALAFNDDRFVERRALAGGIIFSGAGLGGFVFPQIITASCERIGFRWTLRLIALLVFIGGGVCIMGIVPRMPIAQSVTTKTNWTFFRNPIFYIIVSDGSSCFLPKLTARHNRRRLFCYKAHLTVQSVFTYRLTVIPF